MRNPGTAGVRNRLGTRLSLLLLLGVAFAGFVHGQNITEAPIPTANSNPYTIAAGPDGALWFTEFSGNKIGRMTTAGVVTNEFSIPSANAGPLGITAGPDGALWFTAYNAAGIGRMTTAGVVTGALVTPGTTPWGITVGPDGAIWFTESAGNKIGRITTDGVVTNEYSIPTPNSHPHGIVAGPDGALWFVESTGDKIGRITTAGVITETSLSAAGSRANFIVVGPDGALWFTESGGPGVPPIGKIGRITTDGILTEFPDTPGQRGPYGIAAGPDGALWFTMLTPTGGDKIGRITTAGVFTSEFPIPTPSSGPFGIAAGPDGALWFAENGSGKTGRLAAGACPFNSTTFCANNFRFKVAVAFTTPSGQTETGMAYASDASGSGQVVPLTSDTGYFWFFSSNNVEMVIKVVDGRAVNGKFWVFAAGLTNVNVIITVTDTQTGVVKTYTNPQGTAFLPIQDTSAFSTTPEESLRAPVGESARQAAAAAISADLSQLLQTAPQKQSSVVEQVQAVVAPCTPDATTLCLNGRRFQVRAVWTTSDGSTGTGQAVPLTSDTGYLWFFSSNNVEMVIKVVDGRVVNNHYWVFAGGLTNVNVVITVTDTQTGVVKTYTNPQGTAFQPIQDTSAFSGP